MKIRIKLQGCDDDLSIVRNVTKAQLAWLTALATDTVEKAVGCEPHLAICCPETFKPAWGDEEQPCGRSLKHEGDCNYYD